MREDTQAVGSYISKASVHLKCFEPPNSRVWREEEAAQRINICRMDAKKSEVRRKLMSASGSHFIS